jgi:hypothetical protein
MSQGPSHTTVDTFDLVDRASLIRTSDRLLAQPNIPITVEEDIFTVTVAGLDWDIGAMVYEPAQTGTVPSGADNKRIGVFLLHGGAGDFKTMDSRARFLAEKFGYRVVSGTFPGRFYFDDPSRDWPGDTIAADGSVRTPIWKRGEHVAKDEYDVVIDESMRARYGRRTLAKAKPGTPFYDRLAASPWAMEVACRTAMERHFPPEEYSIYVHGHSTGGPLQFMMSQRVANIEGVLAIENSAFGYINAAKHAWAGQSQRVDPFDELAIRTWRDIARYRGPEALGSEGGEALKRLPWLIEDIFDEWEIARRRPQFKCEYLVTWNIVPSLEGAARHTAARLGLDPAATDDLVAHYVGMTREMDAKATRPVPNVAFGISSNSRDHTPEVYQDAILPLFAAMDPAPLVTVTRFEGGTHSYADPEEGLPMGIAPAVFESWDEAIKSGYFVRA